MPTWEEIFTSNNPADPAGGRMINVISGVAGSEASPYTANNPAGGRAINVNIVGGGAGAGVLQLQNNVPLDTTLRSVTDQANTVSPLQLSTTMVNIDAPLTSRTTYNYNRQYLRSWDAKISKLIKETASTQAKIAFIGDSWTSQGRITTNISRYLRDKFGDAGVGYFSANTNASAGLYLYASSGVDALSASRAQTGTWVDNNPSTLGASISTASSSTINSYITYVGYATTIVIHWVRKAGGGDFTYAIDGGATTTINTDGASGLQFTTISGLTDGQHTIVLNVTVAGASGVEIAGIELKRTQNGVVTNNLGLSGSSSTDWASVNATDFQSAITQLSPDLVTIMLGVNDAGAATTTSQYITNLTTLIGLIRASMPLVDICITSPSDIGTSTTYPISDYVTASKLYAIENNYSFIDNYSIIGDYTSANTRGEYANTSHPNSIGGNVMSLNFEDYLMNGYPMKVDNLINVGYGNSSLLSLTSGVNNTAFGVGTLKSNKTGSFNAAFGTDALGFNVSGARNMGIGQTALISNIDGNDNVAIGNQALRSNVSGSDNIAIGSSSGRVTGSNNIFIGSWAGGSTLIPNSGNIGMGSLSLYSLSTGERNTSIGTYSGLSTTTGVGNTYLGYYAGGLNITGSKSVAIGFYAGRYETASNSFYINNINQGSLANDKAYSLLYGTFAGAEASLSGQQLTINGNFNVNGVLTIKNVVSSAVAVASTHKVTISIDGVTYYLLATDV